MTPPPHPPRPAPELRLLLPGPRSRRPGWGLLASILLHLAVAGLLVVAHWSELRSWQEILAAGPVSPGAGGGGGGGGGGGRSVVEVALPAFRSAPPPPAPAVEPPATPPTDVRPDPTPAPVPDPVTPEPAPDSIAVADAGEGGPGTGGGRGAGAGPGEGPGTGPGSGGGSGGGPGGEGGAGGTGRAAPPVPQQLILPPLDYPRELRGRTIAVTFWVSVRGTVEKVALEPEIEDRGFARRFTAVMMNYRFRPARSASGEPTPGVTTVRVTF